jgi:hypothetical protein
MGVTPLRQMKLFKIQRGFSRKPKFLESFGHFFVFYDIM